MTDIQIGELIDKIGPFNNRIRDSEGYEKISLMWDVGNILIEQGIKKIHPVAWKIQETSYITRDLLSYCYRIRRKWTSKSELYKLFHNVKSFTAFRESLPLIENEKFILNNNEIQEIVNLLNKENTKEVIQKILILKSKIINIKNDRRQRLNEVEEEERIFKGFYSYILDIIKQENIIEINKIKEDINQDDLLKLSQMCMAIAVDNYRGPEDIKTRKEIGLFKEFIDKILPLSVADKQKKARFKRKIAADKLIELADILNSIRLGESLSDIRKRLNINIGL
ncbi:MAG: hypothetical protein ACE14V_12510 [bacterium]